MNPTILLTLLAGTLASAQAIATIGIGHLSVEQLEGDMQFGVTAAEPRFGWVLAAGGARGAAQSAYQLQVFKGAAQTGPPLWDSGNVTSAKSYLVPYAGPALASDTTYSWRVRAATTGTSATGAWTADWACQACGGCGGPVPNLGPGAGREINAGF